MAEDYSWGGSLCKFVINLMLGKKIKHPNGEIHDTFLEKKKTVWLTVWTWTVSKLFYRPTSYNFKKIVIIFK